MAGEPETIPVEEAVRQIGIMAERLAMLHYHFADAAVKELGEARGRELVAKAIAAYGTEVGERQRARVAAAGFTTDCENYGKVSDLPRLAWDDDRMPVVERGGKAIQVCPLARYWMEIGQESLGRLYCFVDQAKFAAFDPECEARHLKNVLDGDDTCDVVARKRSAW